MKIRSQLVLVALILGALALAAPALADSHGKPDAANAAEPGSKGKAEPSPEERAAMADAHQRMAECLRSERPMKECRGEMKKAHASFGHGKRCMDGESCPNGKTCPHGESCPHGGDCDGSCAHHGKHGGKHGAGHGAMSTQEKTTGKAAPKDEAAAGKKKAE